MMIVSKRRNAVHERRKGCGVAKNSGGGYRIGSVKGRSQTVTMSGHFVMRDTKTGKFLNVKSDGTAFKGVTKEKK